MSPVPQRNSTRPINLDTVLFYKEIRYANSTQSPAPNEVFFLTRTKENSISIFLLLKLSILVMLRFSINFFKTLNGLAAVLRRVETKIPLMEDLNLPQVLFGLLDAHKGLVLVTGPTGSGKSTTLAAIINQINESRPANIITIEDPVEFIHKDKKSIVSQREVGKQTESFSHALKAALREDPDVILVGELRDLETIGMQLKTLKFLE